MNYLHLNDVVWVRFTEAGIAQRMNYHARQQIPPPGNTAGEWVPLELWSLMAQVGGDQLKVGRAFPIEHGEIRLTNPSADGE